MVYIYYTFSGAGQVRPSLVGIKILGPRQQIDCQNQYLGRGAKISKTANGHTPTHVLRRTLCYLASPGARIDNKRRTALSSLMGSMAAATDTKLSLNLHACRFMKTLDN